MFGSPYLEAMARFHQTDFLLLQTIVTLGLCTISLLAAAALVCLFFLVPKRENTPILLSWLMILALSLPGASISVLGSMNDWGKMPHRPLALYPDQHQCSGYGSVTQRVSSDEQPEERRRRRRRRR